MGAGAAGPQAAGMRALVLAVGDGNPSAWCSGVKSNGR